MLVDRGTLGYRRGGACHRGRPSPIPAARRRARGQPDPGAGGPAGPGEAEWGSGRGPPVGAGWTEATRLAASTVSDRSAGSAVRRAGPAHPGPVSAGPASPVSPVSRQRRSGRRWSVPGGACPRGRSCGNRPLRLRTVRAGGAGPVGPVRVGSVPVVEVGDLVAGHDDGRRWVRLMEPSVVEPGRLDAPPSLHPHPPCGPRPLPDRLLRTERSGRTVDGRARPPGCISPLPCSTPAGPPVRPSPPSTWPSGSTRSAR